jgi:integrase
MGEIVNVREGLPLIRITDGMRVTSASAWGEEIWRLDSRSPGGYPAVIRFSSRVSEKLTRELKLLAAALFVGPGRPLKSTSAGGFGVSMRHLARFMREASYDTLGQLDARAFARFVRDLKKRLSEPGADEEEGRETADVVPIALDEATGLKVGKRTGWDSEAEFDELTFSVAANRLQIWKYLHDVRRVLRRAGIPMPEFDPFAGSTVSKMAAAISGDALASIEDLPHDVALPILSEAHRLLWGPADQVIALQAEFLAIRKERGGRRASIQPLRELLAKTQFVLPGETMPWRQPFSLHQPTGTGAREVRGLVDMISSAAVIILMGCVGWRISELCSMQVEDRDDDEGLPSCISIRPSLTETSDHFVVQALLTKHQPEPVEDEWLIGARSAGSDYEPPTVRAIKVLERLYRPWRRMADDPALRRELMVSLSSAGLPTKSSNITPVRGYVLHQAMRQFITERVSLGHLLLEKATHTPRLQRYQKTNGGCIRPHQWRKTFFRLMYSVDSSLMPAISRHFKHVSLAVTERDYAPRDIEALEAEDSVLAELNAEFLYEQRFGKSKPRGGADKAFAEHRRILAEIIGDKPLPEVEQDLSAFARAHDLQIWPARHGRCMIGLNPDKAACHQRDGKIDWRVHRPNVASRRPDLCCGCANFSIGIENAPFWRERYVDYRSAWLESGRSPAFRFALQRALQAEAILRAIGEPIPIIEAKQANGGTAA